MTTCSMLYVFYYLDYFGNISICMPLIISLFVSLVVISICHFRFIWNHIGGVMVSVLTSCAVDRGFEPRSGQTKDFKIGICCFSAKHAALRKRSKNCLPADCCFSELAL